MSARPDRHLSRRSFLKATTALAGMSPLTGFPVRTGSAQAAGPLLAYVGTFSSPLRDMLPTQVDLPPGNGRGIHLFDVDRTSGALSPSGIVEMGTSPSCLAVNAAGTRLFSANETDRIGDDKEGTASAFVINRADGTLRLLNTVRTGGRGPPMSAFIQAAVTCWSPTTSVVRWQCCRYWPMAGLATPRMSRSMPARSGPRGRRTPHRAASR